MTQVNQCPGNFPIADNPHCGRRPNPKLLRLSADSLGHPWVVPERPETSSYCEEKENTINYLHNPNWPSNERDCLLYWIYFEVFIFNSQWWSSHKLPPWLDSPVPDDLDRRCWSGKRPPASWASSTPLFAGDKRVLLPVIEYACTILLESPVPFSPSLLEEKALNHFLQ